MYQASSAFHTAVANGAPQKALLVFDDCIFTNEDIDVDAGIEMDDYFNVDEDISVGQALSNEIRFTLFNDARLLNNYSFGKFTATIGAQISTSVYTEQGNVTVYDGSTVWRGYSSAPYLRRNGSAVGNQPSWPVKSIMIYGGKVYAFGGSAGQYKVYTNGGSSTSGNLNSFMQAKGPKWAGIGANYDEANKKLYVYKNGKKETYEFVPLGVFVAKRPNVPDVNQITFTCHDEMTKFDEDMVGTVIEYPTTLKYLFIALCSSCGVSYATSTFNNNGIDIKKEPEEFKTATKREVLQWIAEAAGANARINRDGELILDWIHSTGQHYNENNYAEFNPCWYRTETVDQIYNRTTDNGIDFKYGGGYVGYVIQDNPFLRNLNDELKTEKVREAKEAAAEKGAKKIAMCIDKEGNINYKKLLYLSDDEEKWADEAAKWDEDHPDGGTTPDGGGEPGTEQEGNE